MTELDKAIKALQQLKEVTLFDPSAIKPTTIDDRGNDITLIGNQVQQLLAEGSQHQNTDWAAHMTANIGSDGFVGQILSSLHNGNLLSPELYPVLNTLKNQILDWFCKVFDQNHGHFTAGASYGNLEALWQAKQRYPNRDTVYLAKTAHYSIYKACQILGLTCQTISIDSEEKINLEHLRTACQNKQPLAIIATAGTASTGTFDPIDDCVKLANDIDTWCHIDAACGGYLKLLPEHQDLFEKTGFRANSLCFDPHKAWGQPKPCSVLLFQQPLDSMLSIEADYLQQQPDNRLPGSQGGESFLPLWFTLVSSGIEALRQSSRYALDQAQLFSTQLDKLTGWPIFTSPSGIVCFETDQDLDTLIQQGILSTAKRNNKEVYRAVFINKQTLAEAIIEKLQPYF